MSKTIQNSDTFLSFSWWNAPFINRELKILLIRLTNKTPPIPLPEKLQAIYVFRIALKSAFSIEFETITR
jgi:hypothetical protein